MAELINYSNGLRLIVEPNTFVRSVGVGIFVNTGSAREVASNNGISHFIEHVLFKGTDKMSAFDIAHAFESRGAAVNAFTSKETTCFYFKSIDTDVEPCFKTLSELFFHSIFDKKELDSERKVVIEEINMEDDSPEDICYDLLSEALYGDQPLGMTVLGKRENVERFDKKEIVEYVNNQYCADSIVIVFAGNIDILAADELVKEYFLAEVNANKQKTRAKNTEYKVSTKTFIKDFKQTNLMLGYPSICYGDPLSMTQAVLNVIVGGCMGSRLFQHIREKKGLAYSVYSSPSRHSNCGSFNIMLNINAKNTSAVLNSVLDELDLLANKGVTETELNMAKAQLKSTLIFGQESAQSIMLSLGNSMMLSSEPYDIDKKLNEIESVTLTVVNQTAKKLFSVVPALAYVGSECKIDLDKAIRR